MTSSVPIVPQLGQHLRVHRHALFHRLQPYDHHFIVSDPVGGRVVHFWSDYYGQRSSVRESLLVDILHPDTIDDVEVVQHTETPYAAEQIVNRARSQLGRRDFNIIGNNCEDFATWCCTGRAFSDQVFADGMRVSQIGWGGTIVRAVGALLRIKNDEAQEAYKNSMRRRLLKKATKACRTVLPDPSWRPLWYEHQRQPVPTTHIDDNTDADDVSSSESESESDNPSTL